MRGDSAPGQVSRWRVATGRCRANGGCPAPGVARALKGVIVLVGHECVNRVLLLQALDKPLSGYWNIGQDPCAANEIDISYQEIRVPRLNETHHLKTLNAG
jgi:broad specificity phosphatase PhoE